MRVFLVKYVAVSAGKIQTCYDHIKGSNESKVIKIASATHYDAVPNTIKVVRELTKSESEYKGL